MHVILCLSRLNALMLLYNLHKLLRSRRLFQKNSGKVPMNTTSHWQDLFFSMHFLLKKDNSKPPGQFCEILVKMMRLSLEMRSFQKHISNGHLTRYALLNFNMDFNLITIIVFFFKILSDLYSISSVVRILSYVAAEKNKQSSTNY